MSIRFCAVVLACALTGGCITRPAAAPGAEIVDYPTDSFELPSGLRVVVERSPRFGSAGVVLRIGAGSAHEAPSRAGLAHLTEHLAFKARRDGKSFWQRVGELGGGAFNAETSWDATTYLAFVPEQNLDELLVEFASLLADPLAGVEQSDLDHERRIVGNETRLRTENGAPGQAVSWLNLELFGHGHPYALPPVGTHETLAAITMGDVQAFAASYRVAPATLVVSAPYGMEVTRQLVQSTFAAERARRAAYLATPGKLESRPSPGNVLKEYRAAVPGPTLWVGWRVPGLFRADEAGLVLRHMIESTFWSNVYERDQDIARVTAEVVTGVGGGGFYLEVSLNQGTDPAASLASVLTEMRRGMALETYTAEALQGFKRFVAVEATYAEEDMVARAVGLARSKSAGRDALFGRRRSHRVMELAASELAAYWKEHLAPERARAILVRPAAPGSAGGTVAGGGGVRRHVALQDLTFDAAAPDAAVLRGWMHEIGLDEAREATLANGLKVLVLPRSGAPFHTALLGFRGGMATGPVRGAAVAGLWGRQPTSFAPPSYRGARYRSDVALDQRRETLQLTGSDVRLTMELVANATRGFTVRWPIPQFTEQLALYDREYHLPERVLLRAEARALYGEHPYSVPFSPADIKNVRANHVYVWKDLVERPDNAVLVIVGSVDPDAAIAAAQLELSGWQSSRSGRLPAAAPPAIAQAAAAGRVLFQNRPQSTQTELRLSCVLPPVTRENRTSQTLFEAMLGRRFFARWRDHSGIAYHVATDLGWRWGGSSTLSVEADIADSDVEQGLLEVRRFLEAPAAAYLSPALLEQVRAQLAREYDLPNGNTRIVAQRLFEAWKLGWSRDALDTRPAELLSARLDDVIVVAEHCRRNWVLGLLGDEARLRRAWQAAQGESLAARAP